MDATQQTAFLIDGVAYPVPTTFRLADPVLVRDVTGMEFDEFRVRQQEMSAARGTPDEFNDPIVLLGLIAVAVWQRNPGWKRDRVVRFVEQVDVESLDATGPAAAAEAVPVPPEDGGAHESLNGSASLSGDASALVTTPPAPGPR